MAMARKCDRCGLCFDPLDVNDQIVTRFSNPFFQSATSIRKNRVEGRLINDNSDVYIDLCPDCTKAFVKFMEKPEVLEEYYAGRGGV